MKTLVFSWKLKSDKNNVFQKNYQIYVWNGEDIVWDSGKVESSQVFSIEYDGLELKTAESYRWQVISENNYGEIAVSEYGLFYTGIIEEDYWEAKWIETGETRKPLTESTDCGAVFAGLIKSSETPEEFLDAPIYFRKEFKVNKKVKKAIAFATAQGTYKLQLDGHTISNLLAPEYTSYSKHLEYQVMDITHLLNVGEHCIGGILADGWFTGKIGLMGIGNQYGDQNSFLMQMEIIYEDGTKECLITDDSFKWCYGAYVYADLFVGEFYDATKEHKGFSKVGFEDTNWKNFITKDYGYDMLKGQSVSPISVIREIKPVLCPPNKKGEMILDAGEVVVGYTKYNGTK